ncbi:MAG: site-specific integrase [Alphaproteobacteria bacterium]
MAGTAQALHSRFVFHHAGGRYRNVASRFRALVRRADARAKREKRRFKPFGFHDLRHWYAVDYLRRGGNIYDLAAILGHSSVKTTEIYLAHLGAGEQRRAKHGPAQNPAQV